MSRSLLLPRRSTPPHRMSRWVLLPHGIRHPFSVQLWVFPLSCWISFALPPWIVLPWHRYDRVQLRFWLLPSSGMRMGHMLRHYRRMRCGLYTGLRLLFVFRPHLCLCLFRRICVYFYLVGGVHRHRRIVCGLQRGTILQRRRNPTSGPHAVIHGGVLRGRLRDRLRLASTEDLQQQWHGEPPYLVQDLECNDWRQPGLRQAMPDDACGLQNLLVWWDGWDAAEIGDRLHAMRRRVVLAV